MSSLEFNTSVLESSLYNKQNCINELSPRSSGTVLHVNDLYKNILFFHLILKFNIISITEHNGIYKVQLEQTHISSKQFSKDQDPMGFVPYKLTLTNTPSEAIIGHVCVSVFNVTDFYNSLPEVIDSEDITQMDEKINILCPSIVSEKLETYPVEFHSRLNDPNGKKGIFFLKGPEDLAVEVYQYAHRPNSLSKDQEVEIIDNLGFKLNHTMIDFKHTSGETVLMKDVLAFYVNVLGMRVLDIKHNKDDKFSLFFVGYLNGKDGEKWWMEDKKKMILPRRAREGYWQLRYYWALDGAVSVKTEQLGYAFDIQVDGVEQYLNDVKEKYPSVCVDLEHKLIKDPVGHIYTFSPK